MSALTSEKLAQAAEIVAMSDVDVWLTFVRETSDHADPILPFLMDGGLTWQSALMVSKHKRRIAVVGNYDADPLRASGDWDEVIPYVQGIGEPLLSALERLVPQDVVDPRIAVNFSESDDKSDGLTYGMYRLLDQYLAGTRFANALTSAEHITRALRGRKTPTELARIRTAIAEGDALFEEIVAFVRIGETTERDVYHFTQQGIAERELGHAWDPVGDPIVNSGPDSMIGHGIPSDRIVLSPGHIFHIDLGVQKEGYCSDIQRVWYIPASGETSPPDDVTRACAAVVGAIQAGKDALRPGISGWQVDAAARSFLVAAGYQEYLHALGHQVGRQAHDGGGLLGPQWERYGDTPFLPVEAGQVYTLELGVIVPDRGYLGIEEMIVVTDSGCEWLSRPQTGVALLKN
ncbi:MAG: Xaa-Pro peptidase family protein [bacterium]|jgi:Xaa-Pro aminopeptidase